MKNNKGVGIIVVILVILLGVTAVAGGIAVGYFINQSKDTTKKSRDYDEEDDYLQKHEAQSGAKADNALANPEEIRMKMYEKFLRGEIPASYNGNNYYVKDFKKANDINGTDYIGYGILEYAYIDRENNGNTALVLQYTDKLAAWTQICCSAIYYDGTELKVTSTWASGDLAKTYTYNDRYIYKEDTMVYPDLRKINVLEFNEKYELVEGVVLYYLLWDISNEPYANDIKKLMENLKNEGAIESSAEDYFASQGQALKNPTFTEVILDENSKDKTFKEYLLNYVMNPNSCFIEGMGALYLYQVELKYQIINIGGNDLLVITNYDATKAYGTNHVYYEKDGEVKQISDPIVGYDLEKGELYSRTGATFSAENKRYQFENGEPQMKSWYRKEEDPNNNRINYTKNEGGTTVEITENEYNAFCSSYTPITNLFTDLRTLDGQNIMNYFNQK